MSDAVEEVKSLIVAQGEAWQSFKKSNDDRIGDIGAELKEIQKRIARQAITGSGEPSKASTAEVWIDTKNHRQIPVLAPSDSLVAINRKSSDGFPSDSATDLPSVGRLMRGIVMGGRADDARELAEERKALSIIEDPAGGYTVGGALSSEWIDLMRAQMVLTKAGARTVPMDTKSLTLARVTGDPTVSWHMENADITASDPTFGMVELQAKTCVSLVKFSLELAQDSANLEQILSDTLIKATAGAIDSAGLNGVSVNAAAAPAGLFNLNGRNTVTGIGAPTSWDWLVDGLYELMADNVPMENIGALIAHPAVWKKMRKLKTGLASDNTPLTMPAEVAALQKLWTTAAPLAGGTTAKGIIGDWRNLLFGVRQNITIQVLDQAFMGSNLQLALLVHARVDFAATRPTAFCTMEDITV